MIPLLAPLLGSLAGSMLPATLGTGIAASLGLGGTAAGSLVAAAAPKAIGAGIGTLLGGGDIGDAALNAVGFGVAGAAMGGTPAAANAAMGGTPAAANAATTAAGTTGAAPTTGFNFQKAMQGMNALNSATQNKPVAMPSPPNLQQAPQQNASAQANPMLATPAPVSQPVMASNIIPSVSGPSAMPPAVGLGSLPFNGQPIASSDMTMGLSPSQRNMANQYLVGRGMTGFA
jgi:hypothetical protein